MTEKSFSLEEVLSPESLILMDSSAGRNHVELAGSWYASEIYPIKSFYKVDLKKLQLKIRETLIMRYISLFPQTRTVQEVQREIEDFSKILNRKLFQMNKHYGFASIEKKRDVPNDYYQKSDEVKKHFEELCFCINQLVNRSGKIALMNHLETPENNQLFRIAEIVAERPGIIKGFEERYPIFLEKKENNLKTDESLTATAFYQAAYNGQQVRILTGDSDIGRISRGMRKIIKTSPNFRDLKRQLLQNWPQVYFFRTGEESVKVA